MSKNKKGLDVQQFDAGLDKNCLEGTTWCPLEPVIKACARYFQETPD